MTGDRDTKAGASSAGSLGKYVVPGDIVTLEQGPHWDVGYEEDGNVCLDLLSGLPPSNARIVREQRGKFLAREGSGCQL